MSSSCLEAVNTINSHTDKKFRELFALMNRRLVDSIKGQCALIRSDLLGIQNMQLARQPALLPSLVQTVNSATVEISSSFQQVISHMKDIKANFAFEDDIFGPFGMHIMHLLRPDCTQHQQALDVFLDVSKAIIDMFVLVEFQLVMHNNVNAWLMQTRQDHFRDLARQCLTDVDTELTSVFGDVDLVELERRANRMRSSPFEPIIHDHKAIGQLKLHVQQLRTQV